MSETFMSKQSVMKECSQEFHGIMTRREKSKSGRPRYYLYTTDSQNLICCAEHFYNNVITFRIALSPNGFDPDNEFYLGKIEHKDISNKYHIKVPGEDGKSHDVIITSFNSYALKKSPDREMYIEFCNVPEGFNPIERQPFAEINQIYPGIQPMQSKQNVYFKQAGKPCFSLIQVQEDEFLFNCDAPFSIFQAFACACTTMLILKGE